MGSPLCVVLVAELAIVMEDGPSISLELYKVRCNNDSVTWWGMIGRNGLPDLNLNGVR